MIFQIQKKIVPPYTFLLIYSIDADEIVKTQEE